MNKKKKTLTIISPVYNNEDTLIELKDRVFNAAKGNYSSFVYIFVNDGSTDESYSTLSKMASDDDRVKIISFSRNFGQHTAIIAGLEYCDSDHIFIIDADLEEPPEYLTDFKKEIDNNYEIAVGIRSNTKRKLFKSLTAKLYTFIFNILSEHKLIGNTTNMRLITKKYCSYLRQFNEIPFIGGFCVWIGLPIALIEVTIDNTNRKSSYNFLKLLSHARIGLIGFSNRLIRLILFMGILVSSFSFIFGISSIISRLTNDNTPAGYTTIISLIVFLIGIIFIILGIMGEYIIDINNQTKKRPRYIIHKSINL